MKAKAAPQVSPVMQEVSAYIATALRKPLPKDVIEKLTDARSLRALLQA